jgi:hypothetical protein
MLLVMGGDSRTKKAMDDGLHGTDLLKLKYHY